MGNEHDQETDTGARISKRATGPSRSQRRRDALDILQLAQALMAAPAGIIARLPLDDELAGLVNESRAISSHVARKRQAQFLAKQLRRLDDGQLDPMRAVIAAERSHGLREAAELQRLETLRQRLIDGGDPVIMEIVAAYPGADRQRLRQLTRQARRETQAGDPPRASRELLRLLRGLDWPQATETKTEGGEEHTAGTGAAGDSRAAQDG